MARKPPIQVSRSRATAKRRNPATVGQSHMISATAAAKGFGALIDRVRSERAVYVVERGGTPAVRIVPIAANRCSVADLVHLLRGEPRQGEPYFAAVEAGITALNRPGVPEDRWER
jgi:antitoxin (DNA-binding transcriptional repressor) of toxin-antitoxin stability system